MGKVSPLRRATAKLVVEFAPYFSHTHHPLLPANLFKFHGIHKNNTQKFWIVVNFLLFIFQSHKSF